MRFTEGYWQMRDDMKQLHAAQAYDIEPLADGLRVYAPCRPIRAKNDVISCPVITVELRIVADGVFSVEATHFAGATDSAPRFAKTFTPVPVSVTINEREAVAVAGDCVVRVSREPWGYSFEAGGQVLTSSGFRNLGRVTPYEPVRFSHGDNYLHQPARSYMKDELLLGPGELVYGLGERFTATVKNGQSLDTWNEDGGTSSSAAYKCVPFYMTSRGYGVLVDHTGYVSFEVASEKVSRVGFSVEGETLRYLVFHGPTPKDVVRRYCAVVGLPALPPAWSFGLWLSTSFTTDYDEETVASFIEGMRQRDIPLHVFHFDCFWMKEFGLCDLTWDERVFPDPAGMLARHKKHGLRICCWINPYVSQRGVLFREAAEKGYLLLRADGGGVWQIDMWQNGMGLVDFTNPAACAWFQQKLKAVLDAGVDCFKTDFGERIPTDVIYFDGSDAESMHNYYTFLYNKCVFELLERERGEGEALVFARSATAGCQRFPLHWGGDCSATYESMAETLRGGLSFMQSGFAFWSHDISGFEHTAAPDLYKRWCAFGLLSSHSRLHGSVSYRVPWQFDDEACDVLRHFVKLKCRLMPYVFELAVEAHRTGLPVMRPMMMEFPADRTAQTLELQYMLGDSLLVAPVFRPDGQVEYYLPDGVWTHVLSGEPRQGGRWHKERYDYFSLPLFVRENTLLALGANGDRPDYDYADGVELHLYPMTDGGTAECAVPDAAGRTILTVTAVRAGRTITVSSDDAAFAGATVVLHFAVAAVDGAPAEKAGGAMRLRPPAKRVIISLA